MLLFIACWLVLSVLGGVLIGRAIHRADVLELGRPSSGGPAVELVQPPAVAAVAPVPLVHADTHVHARAA